MSRVITNAHVGTSIRQRQMPNGSTMTISAAASIRLWTDMPLDFLS